MNHPPKDPRARAAAPGRPARPAQDTARPPGARPPAPPAPCATPRLGPPAARPTPGPIPGPTPARGSPPGRRAAPTLAALALLAGCAAAALPPAPRPEALVPGPSGLAVRGTGLEIGFGRAEPGAVAAAARLLGPPLGRVPCEGEPGTVVRWPLGLALHFPEGGLSGWERDGRAAGRLCRAPS